MRKNLLLTSVLCALIILPVAEAGAQTEAGAEGGSFFQSLTFSADAGLSMPMGDASELHSMGFVLGVNCFYPYTDAIHIGARIAYNFWGIDDGGWAGNDIDGSSSMMEFVPQVRYLFPSDESSKMSFFGQAGLGFYRYAFDVDATIGDDTYNFDDSDFNLGLCFGGGMKINGGGRTWELRPMLHIVFTEGNSSTYLSLSFGTDF